jgi:hypothetical protein
MYKVQKKFEPFTTLLFRTEWKLADFGIAKLLTMTSQQNYYTDTCAGNETHTTFDMV